MITERVGAPYRDFLAVEPLSVPQAHSFTLTEARELRDSVLLVRYRVNPVAA